MTKNEFARQVAASAVGSASPQLGDWTDWAEFILTLIAGIPCVAKKSPEQALEWLRDHPFSANMYVRPKISKKRPSWATDDDVDTVYDALMESVVNATAKEFSAVFSESK